VIRACGRALACALLVLTSPTAAAVQSGAKPASAFDVALRDWVHANAAMTARAYARAASDAERLRTAIAAFLGAPSEATLAGARVAWMASRASYEPTEVFRFSDGPIDGANALGGREGPENRINAWPMDEAYLDSVANSPRGGLIPNLSIPMDRSLLGHAHGASDDTQVTLGFHAIEFLLWGQDRDTVTAGQRPATDYAPGGAVRDRRRLCLAMMTDSLVADLAAVAREWRPDRYGAKFAALPRREALRRVLSGAATLSGFEMASERISVPLATHSQEDEQSCFSDNTVRDLSANIEGLALVLEGDGESTGLLKLFGALDPKLAHDLRDRLDQVRQRMLEVPAPYDAIILSAPDDPRRRRLEALAGELIGLSGALQRAGTRAGVTVTVGGGG
jgi:putative iron-regulated protein